MDTITVIGFGGTYYTLWSVSEEKHYYTAPNGQHYPSYISQHFTYHKNISTDLGKVKTLYPNTQIDTQLKGTHSFTIDKKDEDLSPEILKSGKYAGWDVRELVKHDLDYVLYMIKELYWSFRTIDIVKKTPEHIDYRMRKKQALDAKCNAFKPIETGIHKLIIEKNPNEDGVVNVQIADGHTIQLVFRNVKANYYNGFTYYLPVFADGKAKRIKGKDIEYKLEITETEINHEYGYCYQVAKVLN